MTDLMKYEVIGITLTAIEREAKLSAVVRYPAPSGTDPRVCRTGSSTARREAMRITHADFDRSLDEILGDASRASLRFEDGTDVYKIRLQRLAGAGRGLAECYCTLNAEDAVQVDTMPAVSRTIGSILLDIASAPKGSSAVEFFAPEGAPSEQWSVGGEGDVRETPLLRKLFQEDEEQRAAMRASGMAPG